MSQYKEQWRLKWAELDSCAPPCRRWGVEPEVQGERGKMERKSVLRWFEIPTAKGCHSSANTQYQTSENLLHNTIPEKITEIQPAVVLH